MRVATDTEKSVLRAEHFRIYARVTIEGSPLDVGETLGVNPLREFTINADVDEMVQSAEIKLQLGTGPTNLSPWLSTSATLAGTAILEVGRSLACQIQCVLPGAPLVSDGWRSIFRGIIDTTDVSPVGESITVHCRDSISALLRAEMENITMLGATVDDVGGPRWGFPVPAGLVSDQLRYILDTAYIYGRPGLTAYPNSFDILNETGISASAFWQDRTNILDAMRAIAVGKDGRDLRGRWDLPAHGRDSFVLACYLPAQPEIDPTGMFFVRERSGGTYPFTAIQSLSRSVVGVKNAAEITPADAARVPVVSENAQSQLDYGRSFLAVSEDKASHIDEPSEAASLGVFIVSDSVLGTPKTAIELKTPFFWLAEINDLFLVAGDGGVSYDQISTIFSVTRTQLSYKDGAGELILAGRQASGAAQGQYWRRSSAQLTPKKVYLRTGAPVGPAVQGARWVPQP